MGVYKLKNKIQNYAWGSSTAMPELLGYENPSNVPMAELWMGAHPKSPSEIEYKTNEYAALNDIISKSAENILGDSACLRFNRRLPYLFKVLAAGSPLSIQAHPNLEQAEEGFKRENDAGIALDAFNRNYKDDNHKPEIICALSDYYAMRGFKPASVIAADFRKIMIPELESSILMLESLSGSSGLKKFFTDLMLLKEDARASLIKNALSLCNSDLGSLPDVHWILRLSELYPGDIGIVSPLYLNVVKLQPGEAMYLPAGELHAYLEGIGMELMASSDNVLRGGLTPKHVDVTELLATLHFSSAKPEVLKPVKISDNESAYITPATEFYLSKIELDCSEYRLPLDPYGPENPSIFICLSGECELVDEAAGERVFLSRGKSTFATFGSRLVLKGTGILYRASIPESE